MDTLTVKDQLYQQFARVGKAVANAHRIELLDLLSQGEQNVEELARKANLAFANTSQHLQVLSEARLVRTRREKNHVFYRLADNAVLHFTRELQALCQQQLAEVDQVVRLYFESREQMEPIDTRGLMNRVQAGDVIVLDVRPSGEYEAGHIPGALSVPMEELERRLTELPKDKEVIAYCRGPYCVLAVKAVALLRQHGFQAFRMKEGMPDWKARGLPVAAGAPK